jgi:hypothetical protein
LELIFNFTDAPNHTTCGAPLLFTIVYVNVTDPPAVIVDGEALTLANVTNGVKVTSCDLSLLNVIVSIELR